MLLAGNSCPYCHLCPFETLTNALTAKMAVLNQPATWLLARADSQSAC